MAHQSLSDINAREAAIALFKLWDSNHCVVSDAAIKRSLRDVGYSFNDQELPGWLKGFRERATTEKNKPRKVGIGCLSHSERGLTSS
jgi:hypothetical protein